MTTRPVCGAAIAGRSSPDGWPTYVARQAVYDRDLNVVAYEPLFRETPGAGVVRRLRELALQGYEIVLDDYAAGDGTRPLLDVAATVKLDVCGRSPEAIAASVAGLAGRRETCRELGFDRFQDHVFGVPQVMTGRRIRAARPVRSFAHLVSLTAHSRQPAELARIGMIRAEMMAALARGLGSADAATSFTVGLLSVADALRAVPVDVLLEEFDEFDERIVCALATRDGRLGTHLRDAYVRALAWADETAVGLGPPAHRSGARPSPAGPDTTRMRAFAPLADRDFRLYFTGEVLSMAGSGLHIVALGWYLLSRTGSATSVGLVWAIGLGSGVFMLPFAGPLADRYPRRLLAIGSDVYRLVLVVLMAALAYAGSPSLAALYMLTFLIGLGHSVFWPSVTALLQEVIRPEQLTEASGLVEITWQAGNLTGAALGGPILVRFGLGTAFAIDAATYALSALALLALHHRPAPAPEGGHESALRMARAGIAYLRGRPAVAGFGLASVIPWVATISLNVVIVAYVLRVLHRGATAYGLADMTYGAGALTSGVFAALLVLWLGEWRAMGAAMVALIACYAGLAGGPAAVPAFYLLLFTAGFCSSAFRVMTSAYLFKVVPNEMMGRTSSTFLLISMLLQVAVTLSVGPLVNRAGARGGFVLLAAIVAAGLALLGVVAAALRTPVASEQR